MEQCYTHTITLTVDDYLRATEVAEWCKENVGDNGWDIKMINWGIKYHITIDDPALLSVALMKFSK